MDKFLIMKMKLNLKDKITEWLDNEVEYDNVDFYIPDNLIEHMYDAASAILDNTIDLNNYFKNADLLKGKYE